MARKEKELSLKELGDEELSRRLEKSRDELFKLRFRAASAPLKNPMTIRVLKREIARINTFINQRRSVS
jgi:large subunit ribosomal protein L29